MHWRKLREARMFGIGIRAFKPRPPPKPLAQKLAEEYAKNIAAELMKPHNDAIGSFSGPKGIRPKKDILLTAELKALAEKLLNVLKTGEFIDSGNTGYGGWSRMRKSAGEFTLYGSAGSHWGNGQTELTVFKNEKCVFACIFSWQQLNNYEEIKILACQNGVLEELKRLA